jgi:rhodanese-related sulfurtransferase
MDAPVVTTEELAAALESGAVVVDVRTDEEWASGHVPGAIHLPLDQLPARWEELPKDQRLFMICASGPRSQRAANALVEAGVDAVNVDGGTKKWIEEGREIDAD